MAPKERTVSAIQRLAVIQADLAELPDTWAAKPSHLAGLESLEGALVERLLNQRAVAGGQALVTVAVVGDFSSGKSTFVNALLGETICPVKPEPTTSAITTFTLGPKLRIEREDAPDARTVITLEEYQEGVQHGEHGEVGDGTTRYHIQSPAPILSQIRLLDTPGFSNPQNPFDTAVTEEAVNDADVLFVVFDIEKGNPSATLLQKLDELRKRARGGQAPPAYLLLNKAALKRSPKVRAEMLTENRRLHADLFEEVLLVDSLELAQAQEAPALSLVEQVHKSIVAGIQRRANFEVTLVGERARGSAGRAAYLVRTEGRTEELGFFPTDDLARRADLLALVGRVGARRQELLEQRLRNDEAGLQSTWKDVLGELRKALGELLESTAGDREGQEDSPFVRLSAVCRDCEEALFEIVAEHYDEVLQECIWVGVRLDEGVFITDTYYQLRLKNPSRQEEKVGRGKDTWNAVQRVVKTFNKVVKDLFADVVELDYSTVKTDVVGCFAAKANTLAEQWDIGNNKPHELYEYKDDHEEFTREVDLAERLAASHARDIAQHYVDAYLRVDLDAVKTEVHTLLGIDFADRFERESEVKELCNKVEKALEETP